MSFPCPTCGELMSTISTREIERRRQCPQGHRVTTIEITREQYDRNAHDLDYLQNLKLALIPALNNFSKELHDNNNDNQSNPRQLRLPGF